VLLPLESVEWLLPADEELFVPAAAEVMAGMVELEVEEACCYS
jgi:hypothetical protein